MSSNKSESKSKIWQLELTNKNLELEIDARKQIERVLKDREDIFKVIFNHAPVAYFLCDLNGDFVDGNFEAIQLTGYNKEELDGTNFIDVNLIDKKDQKAISEIIFRSGRGEYTGPDEFFITKKDGSIAIIELNTSPVTIHGNKRILGVAHDITNRKLTNIKLQESEERFRKLFDSAKDALMTLNPPTWKFTSGNPAILEMFKVKSIKEFLTYGPWDISPEKQPDGRLSSEKAKEMIEIAMTKGSNYFEWTHKRLSGESFPATVLLTKIQLKDETFLQATVRDITDSKQAEELKDSIYMISEAAHSAENLEDLFKVIHKAIGKLVDAKNFYIALYDTDSEMLNFPYFVDEYDEIPAPKKLGKGLTEYVLRTGKLLLASPKVFDKLVKKGEIESHGAPSIDWLGVPLKTKDTTIGVLVIQSYTEGVRFNEETKEILRFVSSQVAMAIERKQAEKALRESEKKYRDLFEKSEDAILIIHNGKFVDCNQSAVNMLRYNNKSELLNTHPSELSPEKQPDGKMSFTKANEIMKIALKNGSYRFEWDHKKSDGEVFPVEVLLTAISVDEKNQILHTVWRDITERKQAEEEIVQKTLELEKQFKISEKQRVATLSTLSDLNKTTIELQFEINERKKSEKALKENEEKYHSLTENIPLGIYRNTPGAKGKFIEVNKALVDMFGFKDREAMLTVSVSSLYISPDERKKFSDKVLSKGFVKNEELRLFRRDGNSFIGSSTARAVKDENGKVIHYDGIIEDVTERLELRAQLMESEEKFRSIVNNSPDIILRIDLHGVITFINYEYSNQKPEDIVGKTIYELMPVEFQEIARSTIKEVFKTGESFSFENLGISAEDSVLWYRNNVAPLRKDGKVIAATIIVTDISEQKQIEILKNEFVGSVSHELRTPLTIIRESLSILSDGLFGELNKEQLDIVNPCMEDVDRLSRIINNLLDISRLEGQKIKLEREMVDIVKLAQSVVLSFGNKAATKNIELVFTPNRKSINLYLDKDRIIQVFMNLIGNSLKFTAKGKIEVFITKKANDVECCIADTGRGIEQKDLGTLFDRFHQVGKVMRAGEKGSGLGLSISKGIINLHNGKLWVDSKINNGSKFCFSLPMYSIDEIIIENIENEIKKVADKHIPLSLLLIKLKNFSNIDSKFSVDKANKVTKLILQIIQDALAPGEFSFTKGKDEVILFSDITKQNIIVLFSKLEGILAESVLKIDKDLTVDLSYGYSLYPDDGDNAGELLQNANKVLLKKDKD